MAARKKRIRGKRARLKQRPRSHDLRRHYRPTDLPSTGNLAVVSVEDPYSETAAYLDRTGNLDAAARLEPARRADGSIAEGAPEWTPPSRPRVTAVRALRGDAVGRTHARYQLDETQYAAARAYQRLAELATGTLHSSIWKTRSSIACRCVTRCRRFASPRRSSCV